MSACRWAFRLLSVQYSGHILLVTYSFCKTIYLLLRLRDMSLCVVFCTFNPNTLWLESEISPSELKIKSTVEIKRHIYFHFLLFYLQLPCSTSSLASLPICYHFKAQLEQAVWLTRACQTQQELLLSLLIRTDAPLLPLNLCYSCSLSEVRSVVNPVKSAVLSTSHFSTHNPWLLGFLRLNEEHLCSNLSRVSVHLEKKASQQVNSKVHIIKSLVTQVDKVQSSNKQVNDELLRHQHSLGRALHVYNRTEGKKTESERENESECGGKEGDRGILGTFLGWMKTMEKSRAARLSFGKFLFTCH